MAFYITISNGLLKNGHRKRMGEAVWEFMWIMDKVTKIDEKGVGWVLGGKPINLEDLAKDLEVSRMTVSRNLNHLKENGYINIRRTPYGLCLFANKAKKRFNRNVDSRNGNGKSRNGNVDCNIRHPNRQYHMTGFEKVSVPLERMTEMQFRAKVQ